MTKELSEKTGNASEAYSKLLEAHEDTQRVNYLKLQMNYMN
jgi:hypothetical protein